MSVYEFFVWCNDTALSQAIRESLWLFPVIEVVHLLSLGLLAGAVLIVDLRLLGLGLTDVAVSRLERATAPWFFWSLLFAVVSGILLFLSEALKCYETPVFWIKIGALVVAILHAKLVRPRWTRLNGEEARAGSRSVAVASISLWGLVAVAGRGIGFW